MHVRQQIRAAVKVLLTNLTTTQDRVYIGRARPLEKDFEPTLLIYTTTETAAPISLARPRTLLRKLTLRIEGHVADDDPPDDILDDIAGEIEIAVNGDPTLGRLVQQMTLVATASATEAKGDQHSGVIRIDYLVQYAAKENAPETAV